MARLHVGGQYKAQRKIIFESESDLEGTLKPIRCSHNNIVGLSLGNDNLAIITYAILLFLIRRLR
jgi:hypothetical protein